MISAATPLVDEAPRPALRARGLTRSYGRLFALDDVSFEVPKGALCGLIGPNGAGKTTLLSILATLDDEFAGEAFIGGASVREDPLAVRKKLGFVPDHANIYDGLTVEEFLSFFAHAFDLKPADRPRAVARVIELAGLETMARRPAASLSKGNTQRLCIARALLHGPELLLLDEPASGLDPRARIELKQLLKRLQGHGVTVLISSHILTELGDFCDTVLVLERGRVVANGRIDELLRGARSSLLANEAPPRRLTLEVIGDTARAADVLDTVPELSDVFIDGELITGIVRGDRAVVARIVRRLIQADIDVARVTPERENLEALFLSVTQGELQ
jgi:ABC-2 type transport system ATP-binding protein